MLHTFAIAFVTLLIYSSPSVADIITLDKIVATVNKHAILQSDVDSRFIELSKRSYLDDSVAMRKQILDLLIIEQVQLDLAKQLKLSISQDKIDRVLKDMLSKNKGKAKIDQHALRQRIETELLIQKLRYKEVPKTITTSEQEIQNFLASEGGQALSQDKYLLTHVLISLPENTGTKRSVKLKKKLKKIQQQLQRIKTVSQLKKAVTAKDVRVTNLGWRTKAKLPSLFTDIVEKLTKGRVYQPIQQGDAIHLIKLVEKQQISAYQQITQKRVQHILLKDNKQKLSQLRQQILAGANFNELAKQHSDDKESAQNGGKLGWVSENDVVPEFAIAMKNSPLNKVSSVFKTNFGWHILQVSESREISRNKQLHRQAQQLLIEKKYQHALVLWLKQIKTAAYITIKAS